MRAHRCQQWLYMVISPGPAANHLEGGGRIREAQAQGLRTQAVPFHATCLLMCGLGRSGRARPRPFALWVQRMVSGMECSFPNMCQVKDEKMRGLAPKAKLVPKVHLQRGIRSCASIHARRSPTTLRASGKDRQWRQHSCACRSSSHVKQHCAGGEGDVSANGGSMYLHAEPAVTLNSIAQVETRTAPPMEAACISSCMQKQQSC